jgi:23S rRNA pseudouridine955/2504/2580 synthase
MPALPVGAAFFTHRRGRAGKRMALRLAAMDNYRQMNPLSQDAVNWVKVDAEFAGQRIDNYLMRLLKGVPKSHIYRILRSGEVRLNKKRAEPTSRLAEGDELRLPPLRLASGEKPRVPERALPPILLEDEHLIVLDKPSGLAVHGGSGVDFGLIELIRRARPEAKFLELVHRLDRDTSGILLVAKKRSVLVALHAALREGLVEKRYLALVKGRWRNEKQSVKVALTKFLTGEGERRVRVDEEGLPSHTVFRRREAWPEASLVEAELKTGRTHQIRVHLAHLGFPIAGDDKYGDFGWNKALAKRGLKRMFLHAGELAFAHPASSEAVRVSAPLPADLSGFLAQLRADAANE